MNQCTYNLKSKSLEIKKLTTACNNQTQHVHVSQEYVKSHIVSYCTVTMYNPYFVNPLGRVLIWLLHSLSTAETFGH